MRALTAAHATLVAVAVVAAVASTPAEPGAPAGCAECAAARDANGWCTTCETGWVGDVRVPSRRLWHLLDAHGHDIRLDLLRCEGCVRAAAADGFCAESGMGFVRGQAYFSRLTWLLARAEREAPAALDCPTCRRNARTQGWCAECGAGRVGRHVLRDRADFEALAADLEALRGAVRVAERCERCAVAAMTGTECPVCRTSYAAGSRTR